MKIVENTDFNNEVLDAILSDDYIDILLEYEENLDEIDKIYKPRVMQIIDDKYVIIHKHVGDVKEYFYKDVKATAIPRCFGPYGIISREVFEPLTFHYQPQVPLQGKGILIGIIDSGIDYTHRVFKYKDNTTKITSIWDQTIQGNPPEGFFYGSEYTREDINKALKTEKPYGVVPSKDYSGHGTFLAGIAAGRKVIEEQFTGVAPEAELVIVKLKEAKEKVKKGIWAIYTDAVVYEDTDIMMGIKYLLKKETLINKPLVIIIGLGSNVDAHDGTSIIERYLSKIAQRRGHVVNVAAGNEGNSGHHYRGDLINGETYRDVEINVAKGEKGYTFSMWSNAPDKFSIAITSPKGEYVSRLPPRSFIQRRKLILEETEIYIQYQLSEERTGDQNIFVRLIDPTEGVWTITIFGDLIVNGRFDIWLSRDGWIKKNTQFFRPDPDTTVTVPSTSTTLLTTGAYNHQAESIYPDTGRGLTRDEELKPDLVAPGVNVYGPLPGNKFGTMTGTSVSTAITGGASALLLEWGIVLGNDKEMYTYKVKNYLIRGATRKQTIDYPSLQWGYGQLNIYGTFEAIRDIKI